MTQTDKLFTMLISQELYQKLRFASYTKHKPASQIVRAALIKELGQNNQLTGETDD